MHNIRIKSAAIFICFTALTSIVLFFTHFYLYDVNFLFKPFHKAINQKEPIRKSQIININNEISTTDYEDILKYLISCKPKAIVIGTSVYTKRYADEKTVGRINKLIEDRPQIIGANLTSGNKGLGLVKGNYKNSEEIRNSFVFLKTKNPFYLSNSSGDIVLNNHFYFSPLENSLALQNNNPGTIDFVYKIYNRYALSTAFVLYNMLNGTRSLDKIDFNEYSMTLNIKKIMYDERGRISYNPNLLPSFDFSPIFFKDYVNVLMKRRELGEILIKIGLVDIGLENIDIFTVQEEVIKNIYSINDVSTELENHLVVAKQLATEWRSFKEQFDSTIAGSVIYITDVPDITWVKNTILDLYILENNTFYKRFPYPISLGISLLFFVAVIFMIFFLGRISIIGILPAASAINLICYIVFIRVFGYDYPVFVNFFYIFIGSVLGFFFIVLYEKAWMNEVYKILGGNVSLQHRKVISKKYRMGKINFNAGVRNGAFIFVNTTNVPDYNHEDESFETESKILSLIEYDIKKNNGVINFFGPSGIGAYFGVPIEDGDLAKNVVKIADTILNTIKDEMPELYVRINISLVIKKEYFDFITNDDASRFRNFGSSVVLLQAMNTISARFNSRVLLTSSVVKHVNNYVNVRMLDRVKIGSYGKVERFFEYFTDDEFKEVKGIIDYFHAGLKLFELLMWEEASYYFKQCLKIKADDIPSKVYLQRCNDFIYIPPPEGWSGTYEVD